MNRFDIAAYGKVFLCRKCGGSDQGKIYAMKVVKKASVVNRAKTLQHILTERSVLEAVRDSPFHVTLHYAFQTNDKLHLILGETHIIDFICKHSTVCVDQITYWVDCYSFSFTFVKFCSSPISFLLLPTDFVRGGELFNHLTQREKFSEAETRVYIAEMVLAIETLHKVTNQFGETFALRFGTCIFFCIFIMSYFSVFQMGIVYRDIKLENILLGSDGHIVLTDFGLSKEFVKDQVITLRFELLKNVSPVIFN